MSEQEPKETPSGNEPLKPVIEHQEAQAQYLATLAGEPAGVLGYTDADGVRTFTHTVVEPLAQGHGIGSALAKAALDDAAAERLSIVPACPFVAAYIQRHPEYAPLVASSEPLTP